MSRRMPTELDHPIHAELLELVVRFRFCTTKQLSRITGHHYGSSRSAARQTARHLKSLRHHELIQSVGRRVGGWQRGSTPAIWSPTTRGHRIITGSSTRQRPDALSTDFIDHTLAVTEVHTLAAETLQQTPELHQLEVTGEPDCWRKHLIGLGAVQTLKPDLEIRGLTNTDEFAYFIEVDMATENPGRVVKKSQAYQAYWRSGEEDKHHGFFPLVLWLVPDTKRADSLKRHIGAEKSLAKEMFRIITWDQLPPLLRDGLTGLDPSTSPKGETTP